MCDEFVSMPSLSSSCSFRRVVCVVGIVLSLVLYLTYEAINDELHFFYQENLRWRNYINTNLNTSTCGPEANSRGAGQKVIAYAIYGSFSDSHITKRYLTPLWDTVNHEVPKLYPGINQTKAATLWRGSRRDVD